MHYTGMAAVRVAGATRATIRALVGASVVIAIVASTVALLLFLWLRNDNTRRGRVTPRGAAVVMGLAIAGMHYTAMAAAHFARRRHRARHGASGWLLGTSGLAVPVVMGAFVILTLTVAGVDHRSLGPRQARDGGSAARERRTLSLGRRARSMK